MKKKLAIHFFGFIRTFRDTYDNFKLNILDVNSQDYEIDIFIHTWEWSLYAKSLILRKT